MGCGGVSTFSSTKPIHVGPLRSALANFEYRLEAHENANGAIPTKAIGAYEVKLVDGTVSSPYPDAVSINQFHVPKHGLTFWQFVQQSIHRAISTRGQHWEWLIEITTPRVRLKYSEVESKSRRLASALYKLGLREKATVIFLTKNISLVYLLYFAVWRLKAIVQLADSGGFVTVQPNSSDDPCFTVCDRATEGITSELMENHVKKQFVLLSIGKLRRLKSTDLSDLLEDDGKGCPDHVMRESEEEDEANDVILITANGACHTNNSLIIGFTQLGLLRIATTYPRQFFYPVTVGDDGQDQEHALTSLFWPLAALFVGKTTILLDSPIAHSVTLVLREFAATSICGCPSFLQRISRHIAEQGGSMPSVTSAVIHSTSRSTFSEKILRKGFPNLRVIDVVYGFEEALFVSSTLPPPSIPMPQELDFRSISPHSSGPLLHPHTAGTLGLYTIAKVVDLDTGVRLGPGEPGELCIKTGSAMKEYMDTTDPRKMKTIVDGWIHSGDFGYYDSSGSLYITGRVDEVFKYYADYIAPLELEFVLQSHPDVRTCAVLGIPDALSGHLPCAVVVRRTGTSVSSKELRTFVNSRVSNAKQLRGGIIFLEELPATSELPAFRKHILDYIQRHNST